MATDNPTGSLVILYVEDNDLNQLIIKAMLNSLGYHNILIASDATEAIKLFEDPIISIDFIFMDLGLPGIDGIALAEKIRQSQWRIKNVPIVALTGNEESAAKTKSFAAGMNGFLIKPVDKNLLAATIEKFCRK